MYDTYAEFAAAQARLAVAKGDPAGMPIHEARALRNAYMLSLVRGRTRVRSSTDHTLAGPAGDFKIRITVPIEQLHSDVVLLLRGSGYWAGTLETHDETARSLAGLTGLRVCAIDYHLTPEFRAPVQLQEATAAMDALFSADFMSEQPRQVVLYGESAGANLALSLAIQERDAAARRIAGMVLFYPAPYGPERQRGHGSYQWVWANYLGPGVDATSPLIPMNHDLGGLCPAWIGVGEADALLPDCVDLAAALGHAGVRTELRRYPTLPHAFIGFASQVRTAGDALRDSAAAISGFIAAEQA